MGRKSCVPVSRQRAILIAHARCKRARLVLSRAYVARFRSSGVEIEAQAKQARAQEALELIARRSRAELTSLRLQLSQAQANCISHAKEIANLQAELSDVKAAAATAASIAANTEIVLRAKLAAELSWKESFVPELHAANARRFAAEEALYRANLPALRM